MDDTRGSAVGGRAAAPGITTFREGSLHAALKARYAAAIAGAQVECAVDGFIVDVVGPHELVEIQTGSFGSAGRKLELLAGSHRIVLVYPNKGMTTRVPASATTGRARVGRSIADITAQWSAMQPHLLDLGEGALAEVMRGRLGV